MTKETAKEKRFRGYLQESGKTIEQLEAANTALREALEWYGEPWRWRETNRDGGVSKWVSSAQQDKGQRARKALGRG